MGVLRRELGSYWEELKAMNNNGAVCHHIIYMLFGIYADKNFSAFSEQEQNILLWAVVFHDLVKRGTVFGPVGRDPFHPFLSAAATIRFFKERNFFEGENLLRADELIHFIEKSKKVALDPI